MNNSGIIFGKQQQARLFTHREHRLELSPVAVLAPWSGPRTHGRCASHVPGKTPGTGQADSRYLASCRGSRRGHRVLLASFHSLSKTSDLETISGIKAEAVFATPIGALNQMFLKQRITLKLDPSRQSACRHAVIQPSPVAAAIRRNPMIAWSQCFGFGLFGCRPSFSIFRAVLAYMHRRARQSRLTMKSRAAVAS